MIGKDDRYLEVADGFCRLVGYSREELLLMKLEALAAPGTADITTAFNPSKATGCAHGLWLLVTQEGTRILVRYESRVRSDLLMQTQLEVIGADIEASSINLAPNNLAGVTAQHVISSSLWHRPHTQRKAQKSI